MCTRLVLALALPLMAVAQMISFLAPNALTTGASLEVFPCASCVAVADFNGDGKPDIAFDIPRLVYSAGGVLLGNGDGTFRPALPFSDAAEGPFLVGDFNGDGKPDLVFTDYVTIYLGNGDGTFANPINVCACNGLNPNGTATMISVQIGDFNHDGRTDILCGTSILLSNGDGTFNVAGSVGAVSMEAVVLVADFNRDGVPDVLLRTISGNLAVVLARGDGTFGSEMVLNYLIPPNSYWKFLAGDFNGDGVIDLIDFSNGKGHIDFLQGNGDGTFRNRVQTDISASPPPGDMTATGDFNNDRRLDFVAGDSVFAGNGDGTFRFPVFFGPTTSSATRGLTGTFPFLAIPRMVRPRWATSTATSCLTW